MSTFSRAVTLPVTDPLMVTILATIGAVTLAVSPIVSTESVSSILPVTYPSIVRSSDGVTVPVMMTVAPRPAPAPRAACCPARTNTDGLSVRPPRKPWNVICLLAPHSSTLLTRLPTSPHTPGRRKPWRERRVNPTDHDPHHTRVVFTRSRSVTAGGARRAVTIMRRMSLPGGSDPGSPQPQLTQAFCLE